ncbi:hypothetical protein SteCoe_22951 [Stentor coeruleus]|uniref:Uncharacterized protein n=1 Tax=Stentor coeruleus TaxID=5963 RepID=A0A1R2BKZ9_9CILI|nr:hypothetical protein SteCoe_22951 [Stentor coeruleus]
MDQGTNIEKSALEDLVKTILEHKSTDQSILLSAFLNKFHKTLEDQNISQAVSVLSKFTHLENTDSAIPTLLEMHTMLSTYYKKQKLYEEARAYLEKAIKIAKKTENKETEAKCLIQLSGIHSKLNEHFQSIEISLKSSVLLENLLSQTISEKSQISIKLMQAVNFYNIGTEEECLKKYKEAEIWYEKAFEMIEKNFDDPDIKILNKFATAFERMKELNSKNDGLGWVLKSKRGSEILEKDNLERMKSSMAKIENVKKTNNVKYSRGVSNLLDLRIKDAKDELGLSRNSKKQEKFTSYGPFKGKLSENNFKIRKKPPIIKKPRKSKEVKQEFGNYMSFDGQNIKKNPSQVPFSDRTMSFRQINTANFKITQGNSMSISPTRNKLFKDAEAITDNVGDKVLRKESSKEISLHIKKSPDHSPRISNISQHKNSLESLDNLKDLNQSKYINFTPNEDLKNNTDPVTPQNNSTKHINSSFHLQETPEEIIEKNDPQEQKPELPPEKKLCVFSSKIDFNMEIFSIAYYLKSSSKTLEVVCSNTKSKIIGEFQLDKNIPVLDYIEKVIEPCISFQNNQLILETQESIYLIKAYVFTDTYTGSIDIQRKYPRWRLEVNFMNSLQSFEMVDIKNLVDFDVENNPSFFVCLFTCNNEEISINLPMAYPLEVVFSGEWVPEITETPLKLKISIVNYLERSSMLVEGFSALNTFWPFLVDISYLKKKCFKVKMNNHQVVECILKNLYLKDNQLLMAFTQFTQSDDPGSEKHSFIIDERATPILETQGGKSNDYYDIPEINQKTPILGPDVIDETIKDMEKEQEIDKNEPNNKGLDYNKMLLRGKSVASADYGDRIIFRTCLYTNDRLYQISMSLTNEEIVNFYIRKGSETDNLHKFSIDITTLCSKTGLDKKYLVPLGSYVLRNMLVIKESDVCFFDFSRPIYSTVKALDKIVGLLKGFLVRKNFTHKLKNLVEKRKIKVDGVTYTCLVYLSSDKMHLRLVRGWDVLGLELNLVKLVKDRMLVSFDKFFKCLPLLGLHVYEEGTKKILGGLENYRLISN